MQLSKNIALSHSPSQKHKYSILIPAAGPGHRMKVYGPKSLIQINNIHTILSKQLMNIRKIFKHYEIILVGGYKIEKLEEYIDDDVKLVENTEYETTNVIESIKLGINQITTDKLIIIYGDLVFNSYCLNFPFFHDSGLVICDSMKSEEVGCVINNNNITNLFYQLNNKWAQISYFTNDELYMLREFCSNNSNKNLFGFEAINTIIDKGGRFLPYKSNKAFAVDIDSSYDLKLIQ